jgi:hypothetical protein
MTLDCDRGKINNEEFMKQIISFEGLKWGSITPMDVDGLIEYHDKVFIFIETKYGENDMGYGQGTALERLCNCCEKAGKISYVLFANHNIPHEEKVVLAGLTVSKIYHKGVWIEESRTVKDVIDTIMIEAGFAKDEPYDDISKML